MKLAELQQYFARAATSGHGPQPDLEQVFSGSERSSASDRLAIYNRGYFYRLLDALASVYGQTQRALGEDFERLGLAYLARYPSDHPAVERVGRSFADYLRSVSAPAPLVDLAAFEWARLCALVAANPKRVATVVDIQPQAFPESRLCFVPSLHWRELDARALCIFDGHLPSPAELRATAAPPSLCRVAIWRPQHRVLHERLDGLEWDALNLAATGASLAQVCSIFDTGSETEDVRRAFQVLTRWFARNWLESVVTSRP